MGQIPQNGKNEQNVAFFNFEVDGNNDDGNDDLSHHHFPNFKQL